VDQVVESTDAKLLHLIQKLLHRLYHSHKQSSTLCCFLASFAHAISRFVFAALTEAFMIFCICGTDRGIHIVFVCERW